VSARELVVLGTASQVPTRHRNHNGYLLRWDREAILFDPGEGTQRQMTLAGVPVSAVTRICLTHLHGDHCLGLPGVVQRLSLDQVARPVHLHYPASGQAYVDRLRRASIFDDRADVLEVPVEGEDWSVAGDGFVLRASPLEHLVPAVGYRVEEPDGRTMVPSRLAAAGVAGPAIGRLAAEGAVSIDGRVLRVEDVSVARRGQRFAFVMDTRRCANAVRLTQGADLLVCEATFRNADQALADQWGHCTATDAGRIAAEAGARRLVLTHFSQRYTDTAGHLDEARAVFDGEVVAAADLDRIEVPRRPRPS
jgi:ribonuclease Z